MPIEPSLAKIEPHKQYYYPTRDQDNSTVLDGYEGGKVNNIHRTKKHLWKNIYLFQGRVIVVVQSVCRWQARSIHQVTCDWLRSGKCVTMVMQERESS